MELQEEVRVTPVPHKPWIMVGAQEPLAADQKPGMWGSRDQGQMALIDPFRRC